MKPVKNVKYIYWLTQQEEADLGAELEAKGARLKHAKGVTCTPLDVLTRIAAVAPEVWLDHCPRAGAWYRASEKNGQFLIVSSFELQGYEDRLTALIRPFDFQPPRKAGPREIEKLVESPEFLRQMPPQWGRASDNEKRIYLRWAHKLGSEIKTFDELWRIHSANHANFIRPVFYIEKNGRPVPYSLDQSAHLCSCCLELFDILGQEHREKLVRPCPGAVFYARLEPDQYFLVEKVF
ncbi:MAG: hypothetical protein EHM45_03395 [Desulfobacteraceae bacterium]|nr:MAG: hypothetical protein EHM45_03395 [Desulfobacteraceae bacterium]